MTTRVITIAILLVAILVLLPNTVLAGPTQSHVFSGAVTVDGEDCPGSIITVEAGDTLLRTYTVTSDRYFLFVGQKDGVPANGETVRFYVDDIFAASDTWFAGSITVLDLAVSTAPAHMFSGAVTVDGEDCPDSIVEARAGDTLLGTVTVTSESKYYLLISQEDGVPANGETVSFYVDDILAASATWVAESNTVLDLAVSNAAADNPSVETGLASIQDKIISVCGYGQGEGASGWTVYNPPWPANQNTLTTLYRKRGYWISVSEECVINYGDNHYNLEEGWNLIGWVGLR